MPIWKPCIAAMAACADGALSYDTNPKHFDKLVCLSINTLAEITLPNGKNVIAKSRSVNSCGKWYINRFPPSGPGNFQLQTISLFCIYFFINLGMSNWRTFNLFASNKWCSRIQSTSCCKWCIQSTGILWQCSRSIILYWP